MHLKLTKCTVRSWRQEDASDLVTYLNNERVRVMLTNRIPYPYLASHAEHFIAQCTQALSETSFAIGVDGRSVGAVGFGLLQNEERHTGEIGYWVAEEYWGRGIATDAVRAVTAHAFQNHDLERLQAHVFLDNVASARVLEKCGYSKEGVIRMSALKGERVINQILYAVLRSEVLGVTTESGV